MGAPQYCPDRGYHDRVGICGAMGAQAVNAWPHTRFTRTGRALHVLAEQGQGKKYHSHWCYYRDGHLHPECALSAAAYCPLCRARGHKAHKLPPCSLCVERASSKPYWYQSRDEARTAQRLDTQLHEGKIAWWRRARTVILQEKMPGQRAITYTPDFVVCALDGTKETLEVKSFATLTKDSRIKIKWYRALAVKHGWPPMHIVTGSGRTMTLGERRK
jgi:hypothetical protein